MDRLIVNSTLLDRGEAYSVLPESDQSIMSIGTSAEDPMHRITKSVLLVLVVVICFIALPGSSAPSSRKRVLILFPYESHTPGFIGFDTGLRSTLTGSKDYEFEFYTECMDLTRFPDERYHDKLVELYRQKYSGLKIDLIVSVLRSSVDFLAAYGDRFFAGPPTIVYEQDPRSLEGMESIANGAVVTGNLDMENTLALALRIHPGVRNVFVTAGASHYDQSLETRARAALRSFESHVELRYLSGLPMNELIHRVSNLPEHSLVLYLAVTRDGVGQSFKSPDALSLISKQANAPIYSVSETYMGMGIVGGYLVSHLTEGRRVGEVALRILDGEEPNRVRLPEGNRNQYVFDARELKRWGIGESSLPPDSVVRFKDFSIWEAYRWRIIVVGLVLVIQALFIMALAVSRRKHRRAKETIRASEEFTRSILASLKNHVAILDKNGTILAVNEAWEQFACRNEAISPGGLGPGVNYLDVCRSSAQTRDDLASRSLEGIQSVLNGEKKEFSLEYPCISPSESQWFLMKAMPFRNPGGGVVVSHTNVTERKNMEQEALRRNEELAHVTRVITMGELATALAHEINQPLTAIRCNAEAAQRFLSSAAPNLEEVRQILHDIISDDTRAGEVIRRMRALVRKENPRRDAVDLNDVILETIVLVRCTPLLDGLNITAELDEKMRAVQGDRVQLQQVTLNLLMNAMDAMKSAPLVSRRIIVRTAMPDSRTAMVSVTDSGKGIDENEMDHLFEPFYTTKAEGLGMGLPISRNIVKAHGGVIWAEDNRECGATFSFTVPLDGGVGL